MNKKEKSKEKKNKKQQQQKQEYAQCTEGISVFKYLQVTLK